MPYLLLLCLLLLNALPAAAQDPAYQDLTSLSIEELAHLKVYSASRHLEDSRKAPSVVTVISADEITRYGWRTLADLLRTVPGFYTAYDRDYTYVGVRGFLESGDYNARFLLLIDGHRANENVYDSALVGTEFPLDIDLIDRVEIVHGPSSSLYGTNAVLAVVNVITRRPHASAVEVSGDVQSSLGRTGRLTATFKRGELSGLISGSLSRNPGAARLYFPEFDTPETNRGIAQNVDGDSSAKAFIDLERGNLRLQGLYGSRLKIIPTGSYGTTFNDPLNRNIDTRGYVDVSYRWSLSPSTDVDVRGFYDAYRFFGSYPYGAVNSPGRSVQINTGTADWLGAEFVVGRKLGRHRLVLGTSGEYNLRIDQANYYLGQKPILNDHVTPALVAGFGEVELNLTSKLAVNAGGRVDWYDTFGAEGSPRVAVMYLPNSRSSLKYIFGRAFRAPDPYDQYYVDQLDVTAPSTNLQPEVFWSHTLVYERSLKPWLGFTAEGFFNQLDHVIEEQQDASGVTHFTNGTGDRGGGAEFGVEAKRLSGWAARASYTFANTWERVNAGAVGNSPSHLAKLNATIPLSRRASAGLELLYTGAQINYARVPVPSSLLTNLTLSTKPLWGGWQFSASCYNLFNRAFGTPTGPDVLPSAVRQDGRGFRMKISYRLPLPHERKRP